MAALVVGAGAWPAAAQQPAVTANWNDARSLALVSLARERRSRPLADTALHNYKAGAEGLVYFYLDRRDVEERVLVRTDQVALEVFWAQPNQTKQRIVGLRDENSLPNRMRYHLDHLTVVQNGFGNIMRMGDGDEVRDVPHPAAPGSDSIYDFRLADSLTIRLTGASAPIKAYEINVKPKRTDRSAFVGSIYVDHAAGDIVRMTFTFTPASYVDRRLDYINISLDNSLWEGRYWLPYEQAVEIRRQVPELDFIVSSVIQARFRVLGYEFNLPLEESLFWGYPVVTVPREQREAYPFNQKIHDDLHLAGLAPPPELKEIRARAAALLRQRALSGLPRLRLSLPNASSALRFNRGEGLYLGWGSSWTPAEATRLEAVGGFAFGAARPVVSLGLSHAASSSAAWRAHAFLNDVRDIGPQPGMPMGLNTLTSVFGEDYLDPFHASGVRLEHDRGLRADWRFGLQLAAERQRRMTLEASPLFGESPFRPVRAAAEGTLVSARASIERTLPDRAALAWGGSVRVEGGSFDGDAFAIPHVQLQLRRGSQDRRSSAELQASAGAALGAPAPQQLFLLGGRHTLPGYSYRAFAGDVFALASFEAARDLMYPFVRARITAAAGWTGTYKAAIPVQWGAAETRSVRTSAGAGVGLLYDLLRFDVGRGLGRGGEWQLIVSLEPRIWSWL